MKVLNKSVSLCKKKKLYYKLRYNENKIVIKKYDYESSKG